MVGMMLEILTREQIERIHEVSLRILNEIGVGVPHADMRGRFRDAGAAVDGSPVIAGDAIFAGTMDGRFVVLALADGRQRWSYEIGGPIAGSPAVAAGMVIVGSEDGSVYAFGASP